MDHIDLSKYFVEKGYKTGRPRCDVQKFDVDKVDLDHTYIDGTKIEANANRYSWVWKKSCIKNGDKDI